MLGDISSVCEATPNGWGSWPQPRLSARSVHQLMRWACFGVLLAALAGLFIFQWWRTGDFPQLRHGSHLHAPVLPAHSNAFLDAADHKLVRKIRLQVPLSPSPVAHAQASRHLQQLPSSDDAIMQDVLDSAESQQYLQSSLAGATTIISRQLHARNKHSSIQVHQGQPRDTSRRLEQPLGLSAPLDQPQSPSDHVKQHKLLQGTPQGFLTAGSKAQLDGTAKGQLHEAEDAASFEEAAEGSGLSVRGASLHGPEARQTQRKRGLHEIPALPVDYEMLLTQASMSATSTWDLNLQMQSST